MMNAAITDGTGKLWLEKIPVPTPNPWQCLCKILVCATCSGTDRKIMRNQMGIDASTYPGILGHESVGVVVECGSQVQSFRKGDWVIRPTAVYDRDHYASYGSLWGAFAEYGLVTDTKAFLVDHPGETVNNYCQYQMKLPSGLLSDPADAVMLITLKEVIGYADSVDIGYLSPVLVLGAGSVGQFFCKSIKLLGGCPLIVAARNPKQMELALKNGADHVVDLSRSGWTEEVRTLTEGHGVMRIVDTTGSSAPALASLPALAEGGKLTPYATYAPGELEKLPADRILKGHTGEVAAHSYVCSLLLHHTLDLKSLYSHRLPFRMIGEGMEMLERKEANKVVFDF